MLFGLSRSTLAKVSTVFFATWAGLFAGPQANAQAVGVTNGEFSVGNGAASYSVPITVPPGTSGMEPKLSLNFSSNSGNGLVGQGWSIGGMSAVQRCPRDKVHDGVSGAIEYNSNDRFCMDGQRLLVVSGTYGASGAQYRTEIDSYSQVISYGAVGSGPAYFVVKTKAGLTMEFGRTVDSFVKATGRSEAMIWSVNKIYDTFGNYLTFTYANDSATGQFRIANVDYTGNTNAGLSPYARVTFEYETRPDQSKSYSYGNLTSLTQRLVKVKTWVDSQLVKEYRLEYTPFTTDQIVAVPASQGGGTQALLPSRLAKISDCDASGV